VCRRAQAHAHFTVLCPARLPRATRAITPGVAPAPLAVQGGSEVLDFSYSGVAGPEGSVSVRLNAPQRFLHFVVGRAFLGVPPGARPARLGGRRGLLVKASANGAFGSAPYFDNHVRFVWREHGTRYVATLHTFGERATERLLDRLLRELRPARSLHPTPAAGPRAVIFTRPSDLALGFGAVWVTTANAAFDGPSILRVDPHTLRSTGRRGAAQLDVHVAAGREGLWTTGATLSRNGHSIARLQVHRIDPTNGRVVDRVPLARRQGGDIAIGDGAVWVSANRFHGDFSVRGTGTVWRINPTNGKVTARTPLAAGAGALLIADHTVWVAGAGTPIISRLDARTGALTGTVRVGPRPFALASADGAIWVTDNQDGTVRRIDPRTLTVTATIPVGTAPYGIAADSRGLWVAVLGDSAVARIDPKANRLTQRLNTGGDPVAIAADGHNVWVALNSDRALLQLTPSS
jgi:YVTN family beta-propeller protein